MVRPDVAGLVPGMPSGITVALASIAETMREGLLAFTTATGLAVFRTLLDEELTGLIGPKHAKNPERVGNWRGTTTGKVVLGGRKISVERPRGRLVDGGGEISSDSWDVFAADDLLQQVTVERMLAGVATRRHVSCRRTWRRNGEGPVGLEIGGVAPVHHRNGDGRAVVA